MKKLWMLSMATAAMFGFAACNNADGDADGVDSTSTTSTEMTTETNSGGMTGNFVDLKTGTTVHWDNTSGRYVDESGNSVDYYVNIDTRDTFYGSGTNVNNALIHEGDEWKVDEAKVKIDDDGEYKSKSGDTKIKVDGDETKIESGDTKIKTEDGETKVK